MEKNTTFRINIVLSLVSILPYRLVIGGFLSDGFNGDGLRQESK